jgi:cytidyltransferase-like protein
MNIGEQIVIELLEQAAPVVALYPGKFKPPHAGHFDVVRQASKIADKVIVIMSQGSKDNFNPQKSLEVWDLYKSLLPSNVEVIVSKNNSPVRDVFDLIKDKTSDFIVLYGKGEKSRYNSIERDREKYSNSQIVDAGTFEGLHATDLRKAIDNKDLEKIQKHLPKGIDAKQLLAIYSQDEFKPGPLVHEGITMNTKAPNHLPGGLAKNATVEELVKMHNTSLQEVIRQLIKGVKVEMEHTTDSDIAFEIAFDHVYENLHYYDDLAKMEKGEINESIEDINPLIQKLVTFACEQLQIEAPIIELIDNPEYTQENSSFGGYMPSEQKIVCVVHNRNLADILRTLSHELVHHMQNSKGELDNESGEDGSPIENEANATAGIIMRKFGRENPEIFENKSNNGTLITEGINQIITCGNCGWEWDLADGGDDPYICHKCGHDNTEEYDVETEEELEEFTSYIKEYNQQLSESQLTEAEYQGRTVSLGKPMRGDSKKFKVYVKNPKGKVVKVNFGAKGMNIKKNNPVRRRAFRARFNCDSPGPRDKARYWSCRKW